MEISIYEEYFDYTRKYTEMHGPKTVVCMQVGSFYEIYGLQYPNSDEITGSLISEVSEITGLAVSSKKYTFQGAMVYMSGFRDLFHTFEKYLNILMEHGYIVVEIIQEKDKDSGESSKSNQKKKTRSLKAIHSAGTHLSYETDKTQKLSNHIMSIWMEHNPKKKRIIYGVSVLNIYTGESAIFEHDTEDWMNPTTFDELEKYVSIYYPSEVLFLHSLDSEETIKKIMHFIRISPNAIVHFFPLNSSDPSEPSDPKVQKGQKKKEILQNCQKQIYIRYILSKYFGTNHQGETTDIWETCPEFDYYTYATQSLCFLLHFIEEHNGHFIKQLSLPVFQNTSKRVVLANHTLKQLNIISDHSEDGKKQGHLSSVLTFLNKCNTAMGKRMFQTQLTQPVFDEEWLEMEYIMTDFFLTQSEDFMEKNRKKCQKIKDLDKIGRQILCKKIYPSSIYDLYYSILETREMVESILSFPQNIQSYFFSFSSGKKDEKKHFQEIIEFLENVFIIEKCNDNNSFHENLISKNQSRELSEAISKHESLQSTINQIYYYFLQFIPKKNEEETGEYIKIIETEKSGISFQLTKLRGDTLLRNLTIESQKNKNNGFLHITPEIAITIKDIKLISSNKSNVEIVFTVLEKIFQEMNSLKLQIQEMNKYLFLQLLETFEHQYYQELENVISFVSKIDVLLCKTYIARKYRYCRPRIIRENPKAFFNATEIRHVLIEQLNQHEIYVANDVSLGYQDPNPFSNFQYRENLDPDLDYNHEKDNQNKDFYDGMVLFGTNAVGKTSLIRSIGIAIIIAQAGIFVPCTSFEYKPYTAIFSRILSNDNLFKGLSTFAVEISELGVILKNADENSFILGDELCSGTETDSALSIFIAALEHLHKKRSSFVFATHFHEIMEMEIISSLVKLRVCHLEVKYDREQDMLVYDRKLKEGEGNRTYGLEVCKSLYLPHVFLERAYEIRRTMLGENDGTLSYVSSRYNSRKIRGICERCKKRTGEEIHHIQEQQEADNAGFLNHWIHKNHPANLMSVCSVCHDEIHHSMTGPVDDDNGNISPITIQTSITKPEKKKMVRKKTSKGYLLLPDSSI